MIDYGYRIYESIISATQSELILFFIALFVFLIISQVPYYRGRKEDKLHEREREKLILDAFMENSAAITSLKVTLEMFGENVRASNEKTRDGIKRVHTRIDETSSATSSSLGMLAKEIARVCAKVEGVAAAQAEMAGKMNKVLLYTTASRPGGTAETEEQK